MQGQDNSPAGTEQERQIEEFYNIMKEEENISVKLAMMEPKGRLLYYQADELSIGRVLNAIEYAEFVLGYLVQNQLIKAKYCYMRAIERHPDDAVLKRIWSFGDHICKKNIAVGLSICKAATFDEANLSAYVEELKNRLIAEQLHLVAKTYSSISAPKLAAFIGSPDDKTLHELLHKCAWKVNDSDCSITPNCDEGFYQMLASTINPHFGPVFNTLPSDEELSIGKVLDANAGGEGQNNVNEKNCAVSGKGHEQQQQQRGQNENRQWKTAIRGWLAKVWSVVVRAVLDPLCRSCGRLWGNAKGSQYGSGTNQDPIAVIIV